MSRCRRDLLDYGAARPAGWDTGWFRVVTEVPGPDGDGTEAAGASSKVAARTLVTFPRTTRSCTRRPAVRRRSS